METTRPLSDLKSNFAEVCESYMIIYRVNEEKKRVTIYRVIVEIKNRRRGGEHGACVLWKKPHTHEKRRLLRSQRFCQAYFLRETAAAETRATAARAVAMPTTSLAPVSGLLLAAESEPAETLSFLSEKT